MNILYFNWDKKSLIVNNSTKNLMKQLQSKYVLNPSIFYNFFSDQPETISQYISRVKKINYLQLRKTKKK